MAYTLAMNNQATGTTAHSTGLHSLYCQNVNWPVDWVVSNEDANRVVLRNLLPSFSNPNTIRFERSKVANIYSGSGIQTAYQSASREGIKLFAQVSSIASLTDESDATRVLLYPYAASLTLRVPVVNESLVPLGAIDSVLRQLIGCFHKTNASHTTDSNSTVGLRNLLLGAINPLRW